MIIKSLKLQNFRQFYGRQIIHFSVESEKKVTVILGDNTAGKTTLIEAFRWCFYSKLNLPEESEVFSKMAENIMKPNEEDDVSVEVCFVHCGIEYTAKTTQTFTKSFDNILLKRSKSPEHKLFRKIDGNTEDITENTPIESIFPEDLMVYLFFTGERLKQLIDQTSGGQKDVRYAVQNVLGLKPIEESLNHLKAVSQAFQKDYHVGSSEQMLKLKKEKTDIDNDLGRFREDESNISTEIEYMKKNLNEIFDRLTKNGSRDSGELLNKILAEKEEKTKRLGELEKKLALHNKNYLPNYLSRKLHSVNEDLFRIESKSSSGMIDKKLLESIIESGYCICGEVIHPGDEHYRSLVTLKNKVSDISKSLSIQGYLDKRNYIFEVAQNYCSDTDEKINEIFSTNIAIQACQVAIEDIKQTLIGKEKYQDVKKEHDKLSLDLQIKNEDRGSLRSKIADKEKESLSIEKKIDEIARTDENNRLIFLRKEYSDKLYQEIENYYKYKEEKIKIELTDRVQKYYQELMGNKSKIILNDDYTFIVKDIDGSRATSDGQDVITSFAFIGGIIDLAKNLVDQFVVSEPYPLIMDAPFAKLDEDHQKRAAKKLPELCEQFVLFTIASQYNQFVKKALSSRVGKEYNILLHSVSDVEKYSKIVEVQ